jgi:hypothetical protein
MLGCMHAICRLHERMAKTHPIIMYLTPGLSSRSPTTSYSAGALPSFFLRPSSFCRLGLTSVASCSFCFKSLTVCASSSSTLISLSPHLTVTVCILLPVGVCARNGSSLVRPLRTCCLRFGFHEAFSLETPPISNAMAL